MTNEAPTEHTDELVEDIQLNAASQAAVLQSGATVVGTARRLTGKAMLIVRGEFQNKAQEKATVRGLEKKLRKANPKWSGILLHIPEGMELMQLPAVMVEALYEALMSRFDPDLLEMRLQRRAVAEKAEDDKEQSRIIQDANAIADHLSQIKAKERQTKEAGLSQKLLRQGVLP